MSLAVQDSACAKTEQADYDIAAAFLEFGERPEPEWEPIRAADIVRLAVQTSERPANEHGRPFPRLPRRALRLDPELTRRAIVLADWAFLLATAELAAHWSNGLGLAALPLAEAAPILACALALKAGLWLTGHYRTPLAKLAPDSAIGGLALGAMSGLAMAAIAAPDARATAALAAILPVSAILLAGVHGLLSWALARAARGGVFAETAVIVGATPAAERFARRAAAEGQLRLAAIVDDRAERVPSALAGVELAGGVDDLLAWPDLPNVDRIVIGIRHSAEARVRAVLEKLRKAPNRVDLLLDYEAEAVQGRRFERLGGAPLAILSGAPSKPLRALAKRAMDICLSALLFVLALPVMALIALAIRIDSEGPALYRQRRWGYNNRPITIWKFRTMRHEPETSPMRQVCAGDVRITRIGRFLRRTSLDELPQLINVLAGEMSLVGPRPHAIDMRAGERPLDDIVADYAHRHRVKPGITGWAQINGSRGPVETDEAVRRRVRLDIEYIARASIWFDLWILARTAPALLGDRKNVR